MTPEELSDRLWQFAARVGKVVDALPDTRLGRHVAGQLVRCGTSSPPNFDEGCNAESKADFIHKLSVALKEMRETHGWLRYIEIAELQPLAKLAPLIDESQQLCRILGKSLGTAKGVPPASAPPLLHDGPVLEIPNFKFSILNSQFPWLGLDHIAIVVSDTEAALKIWRDKFGFPLLYTEDVNNGTVRLTHLDLGNTHLQLVEPLMPEHPLRAWLTQRGPGLHHFCLKVDDVGDAMANASKLGLLAALSPHQGTQGKRAVFLDAAQTQSVQVELTGT